MRIIIVKDTVRDNEWGHPDSETIFVHYAFPSFEKAKKECMKNFNEMYRYYGKFEPYDGYGFYIPAIKKRKDGISILFTVYPKNASFKDVVGDEKEPILQVQYRLIEVDKLPCD